MGGRQQLGRGVARMAAVLTFTAGLAGAAMAADIGAEALPADDLLANDLLAKAPQVEETSFWYLRLDGGYVVNEAPDAGVPLGASLDDAGLIGIGIGGRFSDWLRLDITADYRTPADAGISGVSGDFSVATLLANAYVDLGNWHNLTPYVGAGIGGAYADLDAPGYGSGWGLAWGVMGGVAVSLAPNMQLDVGYRYLNIENVDFGGGLPEIDQSAHEIRVGLRFLID